MSEQQQRQLDAILRQGQFDTGADVQTLRTAFGDLMAQVPVAPDVQQKPVEVGGVAGVEVTIQGNEATGNDADDVAASPLLGKGEFVTHFNLGEIHGSRPDRQGHKNVRAGH